MKQITQNFVCYTNVLDNRLNNYLAQHPNHYIYKILKLTINISGPDTFLVIFNIEGDDNKIDES